MSVFTQGNILQSFVVNNTRLAGAPTLPAATADLLTVMADSQVVAVGRPVGLGTLNEQVIPGTNPAAGTYDYFRLVQKVVDSSGVALLNYGPIVKLVPGAVTSAATRTYVAPAEQIYYIGYTGGTGSSGSIDVSQSNEFMLTIAYDHDDMMWSEQKLRNTYDYYSAAPTQQGVAMSMTAQINYKEQLGALNGTGKMVVAEMLAQGTAVGAFSGNLTVANGSTTITAASAQTWTVGQVIRIGAAATTASDPAYVITNVVSSTVATIHMPYQGTTGTVLAANLALLTGVTNYGIRIIGQPLTFQRDFFKYNKVKFHFDLKGFGSSNYDRPGSLLGLTAPVSRESSKGNGFWQEASEYESFSMGNEGALNRMVIPIPPVRGYVSSAVNYNVTSIGTVDYTLTGPSSSISGNTPMRLQQFVFFPTTGDGVTNRTQLNSQLSNLVGTI